MEGVEGSIHIRCMKALEELHRNGMRRSITSPPYKVLVKRLTAEFVFDTDYLKSTRRFVVSLLSRWTKQDKRTRTTATHPSYVRFFGVQIVRHHDELHSGVTYIPIPANGKAIMP